MIKRHPRHPEPRRYIPVQNWITKSVRVRNGWKNRCEKCDKRFISRRSDTRACSKSCSNALTKARMQSRA